jgi:hypothetical protein
MRKSPLLIASLLATTFAPAAFAQSTGTGFQADRFNPSERGSEWFEQDSLDLRGTFRPAIGLVGEYANHEFVAHNPDGSDRAAIVSDQLFLHLGASIVMLDRLRVGVNFPFAVVNGGTDGTSASNVSYVAPNKATAGDTRFSADLRLVGEYGKPFTLAIGGQLFMPTGSQNQWTGDDLTHGIVRLAAAGEAGAFIWAANVGYHVRAVETTVNGFPYGSALIYGAAAGVRVANRHLVVGPEIYGEANTGKENAFFKYGSTPVEALLGAHYTIGQDWRIGAGAGPGITHDLGSPVFRILGSVEWVPGYHPPPPPAAASSPAASASAAPLGPRR